MENAVYIPLSTRNLEIINKLCETEYMFDNETDLDKYSCSHVSLKGIHVLEVNNTIILVNTPSSRYPLSYHVNNEFLQCLRGSAFIEYLSNEIAIISLHEPFKSAKDTLNSSLGCLDVWVAFTQTKQGRRKA